MSCHIASPNDVVLNYAAPLPNRGPRVLNYAAPPPRNRGPRRHARAGLLRLELQGRLEARTRIPQPPASSTPNSCSSEQGSHGTRLCGSCFSNVVLGRDRCRTRQRCTRARLWHASLNLWSAKYIYRPLGGKHRSWLAVPATCAASPHPAAPASGSPPFRVQHPFSERVPKHGLRYLLRRRPCAALPPHPLWGMRYVCCSAPMSIVMCPEISLSASGMFQHLCCT